MAQPNAAQRAHFRIVFAPGDDIAGQALADFEHALAAANRTLAPEALCLDGRTPSDAAPSPRWAAELIDGAQRLIVCLWSELSPRVAALRDEAGRQGVPVAYYFDATPMSRAQRRAADAVDAIAEDVGPEGREVARDALRARLRDDLVALARRLREAPPAPPESNLTPYLRCLVTRHATVELPGLEGNSVRLLPLERVYTELRFTGDAARARSGALVDRGQVDLEQILGPRLLAIVGDPGAGKTTILRYLALRLARVGLGQLAPSEAPDRGETPPTPVFIGLRELTTYLADANITVRETFSGGQWAQILAHFLDAGGCAISKKAARALLDEPLLLMFDGLDELSDKGARRALAKAVAALGDAHERLRIVITCRVRAWGEDGAFRRFEEAHVQPLRDEDIAAFVGRWADAVHAEQSAAVATRDGLLRAIHGADPVRRIATNPQMLTLLAVLYQTQKRLPEQRAALYRECFRWLTERSTQERAFADLSLRANRVRRALTELALQMQLGVGGAAGRDALRVDQAAEIVGRVLEVDADTAEDLLQALQVHVGLLTQRGQTVMFQHRTLQEYCAAVHIAAKDDPWGVLGDKWTDANWTEVIALTAGVLADAGGDHERLTAFLTKLVGEQGKRTLAQWAPRVGLAAYCLQDLTYWDVAGEVTQPVRAALDAVLPVLTDPESGADADTRIAVALGFGQTRDPRMTREAQWVPIPAGPYWRGAAPGDGSAHEDEQSPDNPVQVDAFDVQRWPVTVGQFREFVDADGYRDRRWWSDAGWRWREEAKASAPGRWPQDEGDTCPVHNVSWFEARAWCRWMTERRKHVLPPGWEIRLPTEAEWEKAARGDALDPNLVPIYPWGREWLDDHTNNLSRGVTPVGTFPKGHVPKTGLWDPTGNVWEWCLDVYAGALQPLGDAPVHSVGQYSPRVLRGGGWGDAPLFMRVSCRSGGGPGNRSGGVGFRCVRAPAIRLSILDP